MSLKAFHVVFIFASLILSIGFSAWGFQQNHLTGDPGTGAMAAASAAVAVALCVYLPWFIRKMRRRA